jgi:hypothetical protein
MEQNEAEWSRIEQFGVVGSSEEQYGAVRSTMVQTVRRRLAAVQQYIAAFLRTIQQLWPDE